MESDLRGPVARALAVGSIVGLLITATMLPTVLALASGNGKVGYFSDGALPRWARWSTLSPTGVGMMLVGALCVLLLVSGRWPTRIVAVIAVIWSIDLKIAFASGSYWNAWIANNADATPYSVAVTINAVVVATVCALCLLTAARLRRELATPAQS